MATKDAQPCSVCEKPIDGKSLDVQLGPVCIHCKIGLRWAHFWLTRDTSGIMHCTSKHNYRLKNIKGT